MMGVDLKPVRWIASSLHDLRAMLDDAQDEIGYQLWRVQTGLMPEDFKSMPSVGAGVFEIRAHTGQESRLIYVAKFAEAIYVLHVFEKRTRKTPNSDLKI